MKIENKTSGELTLALEAMHNCLITLEECKAQLDREQKKYSKLLESAPDAIVIVNSEARIIQVNAQCEKLFGYQRHELNGKLLDILIPELYREKHRYFVANFYRKPSKRSMGKHHEIYGVKKNGEEFPVDISLSFIEIDGEINVTAAVRDVSERKQAEEKITQDYHVQRVISTVLEISLEPLSLEEHLQEILKLILSIPGLVHEGKGGIYLIDRKENALLLTAWQGFPESHVLPCRRVDLGECLCGKAARDCTIVYAECLDDRHTLVFDDHFPHGHYCVPILDSSEAIGLINVFVREGHRRNATEEKFLTAIANTLAAVIRHHRTEEEKDQLLNKLAESEKMVALGRLTSNFTHEIRNPLTAVGGLARRLAKRGLQDSLGREYVKRIIEGVDRLEDLLKNLVAYSRSYTIPQEKYDLLEIIKSLLFRFSEQGEQQLITIETSFEEIPMVHIDRKLVEMALENLIINAINAMPEGGKLKVSTDFQRISAEDLIVLRVEDTGVGIPEEKIPLIFEPLFTTKLHAPRPGLGLASTKKLFETYGGTISVQSKEGEGTTFTITLPVKK